MSAYIKAAGICVTETVKLIYLLNFQHVEGEVYEVSESKLMRLDEFEGHPDFYLREKVPVALTKCKNHSLVHLPETIDCWVYFLSQFEPMLVELPYLKNYPFPHEIK